MNKYSLKLSLILICVMQIFMIQISLTALASGKKTMEEIDFRPITRTDYSVLEQGFSDIFEQKEAAKLAEFYLIDASTPAQPLRLVNRKDFGWGDFSFNQQASQNVFLQVPHQFFDKYTLDIANHWWNSGKIKALMNNSIHRHYFKQAEHKQKKHLTSDFSKMHRSPFIAASRAFVSHFDNAYIIQLHGFSANKRKTESAKSADIILSYGSQLPQQLINPLATIKQCIQAQLNFKTLIFPTEVKELGATRNVVGRELKSMGLLTHFIHVEMNLKVRNILREEPIQSRELMQCFLSELK